MLRGAATRQPLARGREQMLLHHEAGSAVENGRFEQFAVRSRRASRGLLDTAADLEPAIGQGKWSFMPVFRAKVHQPQQLGHPIGTDGEQPAGRRLIVLIVATVQHHRRLMPTDPEPEEIVIAADVELAAGDRGLGAESKAAGRFAGHLRRQPGHARHDQHRLRGHVAPHPLRVVVHRGDDLVDGGLRRQRPWKWHHSHLVAADGLRASSPRGGEGCHYQHEYQRP